MDMGDLKTTKAVVQDFWESRSGDPAGSRVAAVTNLIQAAKMDDHDPYSQMRDVMAGLPVQHAYGELP